MEGRITMKKAVIKLILFYQRFISPLKPRSCRFLPTCSQYAIDAIEKYGIIEGGWMAFLRVIRCNPFNPGGYDPVCDK